MSDFIVTLLFFASMEVVSKPLLDSIDPLTLTFWRFAAGALVLFIILLRRRGFTSLGALRSGTVVPLFLMGVVNIALAMSLLQTAVKLTSAAKAATVFCANPVLVFVISAVSGTEKANALKVLGLLAGLAGLVIVSGLHTLTVDTGTVFALLAAAAFALYTVLGKKVSGKTDPVTINVVSFAAGLIVLFAFLVAMGRPLSPAPLVASPGAAAAALYLTLGVSGIAYLTFVRAIRRMGAVAASMVFMLKPAVASLLAMVFLGEVLTQSFWVGLTLTSLGSYLVMRGGK
ncbi:MAG: DMT family transporter [Candidatus Fermentibacteraceae bacterium]